MGDFSQICGLFTHAATGFAVTEPNGTVLSANKTLGRLVDRVPADMHGTNLFELTHPDDQAEHGRLLQQLLNSEIPGFVIEKRYVRPDGAAVWVRSSVTRMDDEQSPSGFLVHTCEDIGERKRAEQVLEQQEQLAAIGRLTSSILHEVNNPLEAVLNLIFLAQNAATQEDVVQYLKFAQEELGRISEITLQGLQFHRQTAFATKTSVVAILQTVLTLFKARLKAARIKVELNVKDAPELMCFAGEIRQIFVNLIDNAVEAMEGGGVLKLRVRPSFDWRTGERGIRVTIADTGAGISSDTRAHMYKAFYTTKGSQGSGLGLWVTANIVRKHRGAIHVYSSGRRGLGTVFSLIFPVSGASGRSAGFQDAA